MGAGGITQCLKAVPSSRGSGFNFQHQHGGLQLSITLLPEDPTPFSDPQGHCMHAVHSHIHKQNIHTYKTKNLKPGKKRLTKGE